MARFPDLSTVEVYLMAEFRRGKGEAFEVIYHRYHGAMLYFIAKYINDAESAQDIASELFIKLWNLREDFQELVKVQAFLYVSAKNASYNHSRREKLSRVIGSEIGEGLLEMQVNGEDVFYSRIF